MTRDIKITIGFVVAAAIILAAQLFFLWVWQPAAAQQQQEPTHSPEAKAFWDLLVRCTDEAQKLANGTASAAMINTCDNSIQEGMTKYCGLEYNEEVCNPANKAMADMYYIVRGAWR